MATDDKPKSLADRVTIIVALAASICSAVLAIFNVGFYLTDRQERQSKQVFDNQVTIAKTYFDTFSKLPPGEFCGHQSDALLFGRTSLQLAKLDEKTVIAEINAPAGAGQKRNGVEAVSILIYSDLLQRTNSQCNKDAVSVPASKPGALVDAVATGSGVTSTYALKEDVRPTSAAAKGMVTVWIHYAAGDSPDRARAIQGVLQKDQSVSAPGIQRVAAVPNQDQIRIYRRDDEGKAREIAAQVGLQDAQIVNLAQAYKNLPAGVLEIWLKRTGAPPPAAPAPSAAYEALSALTGGSA